MHSRVSFYAYGNAAYRADGDLNRDGIDFDSEDLFTILLTTQGLIDSSTYQADTDIDRNGEADFADLAIFSGTSGDPVALPVRVTVPSDDEGPDCNVGYAGYFHMPELGTYLVRYRVRIAER